MNADENDRSLTGHLAELMRQTIELLRKELKLAKVELGEKVDQARQGITTMALGSLILAAGLLTLLAAAVLGLGMYIPYWVAALVVGSVVTLIGGAMLGKGRTDVRAENLEPQRTLTELQRDKRLVEEHV